MKWQSSITDNSIFDLKSFETDSTVSNILVLNCVYQNISVDNLNDISFELDKSELAVINVNKENISLRTSVFGAEVQSGCAVALTTSHGVCHISSRTTSTITVLLFSGCLCDMLFDSGLSKRMLLFGNVSKDIKLFVSSLPQNDADISEISTLSYSFLLSLRKSCKADQAPYPPVVEAALGIIEEDYAFLDGVQDLAERVDVSVGHLTRLFKQSIGLSPNQCIVQFRIAHSKQLLLDSSLSITMVAELCGFSNSNYFAKVFRAEVGISPSDYIKIKHVNNKPKKDTSELYIL